MERGLHGYAGHGVWEHGFGVAVHYAVDGWEALVDLAVNEPLLISLFSLRVDG